MSSWPERSLPCSPRSSSSFSCRRALSRDSPCKRRSNMSTPTPPFSIQQLLGKTLSCTCGVEHTIPTQAVIIAEGALEQVPSCCTRYLPGKQVLLVVDEVTYRIAGERVQKYLADAGYAVEPLFLRTRADGRVVADDENVAHVRTRIRDAIDFLVAVGAGTVNDVAKLASYQAERPYLVCPTAPSMNGFTSGIAAILSRGVKRTIPAHTPVAVVADLNILSTAPPAMIRAGLGDMISKPVSNADWKLTQLIKGGYYCEVPLRIVEEAEQACRANAAAIGQGEKGAIGILTEALILSGFSMVVAGSSSPASGGEHLLSHYWDMTAHWHGREENFHGAQVGVATLVSATLYEKLQRLDPQAIDWTALRRQYPDWEELEQSLHKIHGPLAVEVIAEARKKYLPLPEKEKEWQWIRENWDTIWQELSPILVPAARIREILLAAGAPTTMRELGIGAEELRTAFLHAKDIRGRYTVLDFAHDLGVLEGLCEEVLSESGVLG
ncbi:MAG: sn-glycerol-1-phosphate dehydrogenase [Nitrospinota bacterium]|nr:MAG: sn-glycerol-1-phosphate dehydrogenase [Nitrospinota bacterium]